MADEHTNKSFCKWCEKLLLKFLVYMKLFLNVFLIKQASFFLIFLRRLLPNVENGENRNPTSHEHQTTPRPTNRKRFPVTPQPDTTLLPALYASRADSCSSRCPMTAKKSSSDVRCSHLTSPYTPERKIFSCMQNWVYKRDRCGRNDGPHPT